MKCSEPLELKWGDCLEEMKSIPEGSIDAIITDPPYGTTACKWDSVIPFGPMWTQLKRIIKPNGAIVLFGSEPFSSALRMSNIKMYKYDWVWNKAKASNFPCVKSQPLKIHENISVFNSTKAYTPQMTKGALRKKGGYPVKREVAVNAGAPAKVNNLYYPKTILDFSTASNKDCKLHPTQKPVALMEYLIKTYTHPQETVLDFTMGSGTTGVACVNTNRRFIGIEQDDKYFAIAVERIALAQAAKKVQK
jgi:site-specific DNA-methyltransferase (adenine-specific)